MATRELEEHFSLSHSPNLCVNTLRRISFLGYMKHRLEINLILVPRLESYGPLTVRKSKRAKNKKRNCYDSEWLKQRALLSGEFRWQRWWRLHKKGCRGATCLWRIWFNKESSHTQRCIILLIFTGQLDFKLVRYISIKPYIMTGFTTCKKELSLRNSNTYYSSTQAIGKF